MSNDIYRILQRFDSVTEGLNPEQEKVKQLPALFRPKDTSPQLSGPYPGKNATLGYLVGEGEEDTNPMRRAVTHRIVNQHPEWIMKYGVEALMQAIDDATEGEDDFEEIGTSDVSAYVRFVKDRLDDHMGSREEMDDRAPFTESATTEDVISTVKKKLGDYLSDLSKEIKQDPDLKDKLEKDIDQIGPAVKTLKTDDGHEIKIHGNEDDGFRITIKNKQAKTKFESLDEAVMACEMYCSRRRKSTESVNTNTDYIEEA